MDKLVLNKLTDLQRIIDTGLIAVIRADSPEQALSIAAAVKKGGIDIIEITLTVPGAIQVIEALKNRYSNDEILLGAGTVLDPETARIAMLAGAKFFVSPTVNLEVIRICNRYGKLIMPGCITPTEIVIALEAGADVIKIFPGSITGPSIVKAFKGPFPQANFIPTGGVNLDNIDQWIQHGCVAVGVGSELTKGAESGNFELITETARTFIDKIRTARKT